MIQDANVVGQQRDDIAGLPSRKEVDRVSRDMQEERIANTFHDAFFEADRDDVSEVLHQSAYKEEREDHKADVANRCRVV